MREALGIDFVMHWCLDHRIDLLYKGPFKKYPEFFGALKSAINDLASFFTQSWKRTAYLFEFCKFHGYKAFRMKHTHDVRWVHSYHQVIMLILEHWLPLIEVLMEINSNMKKEFDKKTEEKAEKHLNFLRDKNAMIGVAVVADISNRFSVDSLKFQRKFGSLIGWCHYFETVQPKSFQSTDLGSPI